VTVPTGSVAEMAGEFTGVYWRGFKQKWVAEQSEVVTFCHGLKFETSGTVPAWKFSLGGGYSVASAAEG
jgi:hypothetical protein